ncbi:unnamed protein product [Cochlearia groenlandica]
MNKTDGVAEKPHIIEEPEANEEPKRMVQNLDQKSKEREIEDLSKAIVPFHGTIFPDLSHSQVHYDSFATACDEENILMNEDNAMSKDCGGEERKEDKGFETAEEKRGNEEKDSVRSANIQSREPIIEEITDPRVIEEIENQDVHLQDQEPIIEEITNPLLIEETENQEDHSTKKNRVHELIIEEIEEIEESKTNEGEKKRKRTQKKDVSKKVQKKSTNETLRSSIRSKKFISSEAYERCYEYVFSAEAINHSMGLRSLTKREDKAEKEANSIELGNYS